MNELELYIGQFFGLNNDDIRRILPSFKSQTMKKGEFYLKAGETCRRLSFQISGYIRMYSIRNENEITQWISSKGGFVTDLNGVIFNQPSKFTIEALTDCTLSTISSEDYAQIGNTIPAWHHLEKLFIARCFVFMEDRVISLLAMSAEERYQWFFNYNPELFNQVPLQYLASAMGMTPETLSRIRKKQLNSR